MDEKSRHVAWYLPLSVIGFSRLRLGANSPASWASLTALGCHKAFRAFEMGPFETSLREGLFDYLNVPSGRLQNQAP